jgi:hypothetical protein
MGWLLPVGVPGGTVSGFDGVPDGSGIVRHGNSTLYLEAHRYRLWRATDVGPEPGGLLKWAEQDGIPDAGSLLRTLQDASLVIERRVDPRLHAARIAVRLTGECLGNGPTTSPLFAFSGRDEAIVQVDLALFETLLRSDGVSPIAGFCEQVDAETPGDGPPVVERLYESLPLLVSTAVVRLDMAVR